MVRCDTIRGEYRARISPVVFLNALLKRKRIFSREHFSVAYPDMTPASLFPGFDGLMTLSRREGVDIRPTLLRVLTDLYVQANAHSTDEERQFVELTSRLIDQVDDATRTAVRARLAIYPGTPLEILRKLGLKPGSRAQLAPPTPEMAANPPVAAPVSTSGEAPLRPTSNLPVQPNDAAGLND